MISYNIKPYKEIKNNIIELSIFDNIFLNIDFTYEFEGLLEIDKLKESLSYTLSIFPFIGGKLITEKQNYYINNDECLINLFVLEDFKKIDVLDDNKLFKVYLKYDDNKSTLKIILNHIIGDGKTIENIIKIWSNKYKNINNKDYINLERYKKISEYKNIKEIVIDKSLNIYGLNNFSFSDFPNIDILENVNLKISKKVLKILKKKQILFQHWIVYHLIYLIYVVY